MAQTVDQKLLKQTKFPAEFNQKVDMRKVNVEVMKKWIASRIVEILEKEDDIVIEMCYNHLEKDTFPKIKELQIQVTGFLGKDAPTFCKELWNLCISAQDNPQGVPKVLLEAKKQELMQEKAEADKAAAEARTRREEEQKHDRDVERVRQREREERSRGGRGRYSQGGRNGQQNGRRQRSSRSPPRHRRNSDGFRGPQSPREVDSYVPRRSRSPVNRRRFRSPSRDRERRYSPDRPRHRREAEYRRDRQHYRRRRSSASISPARERHITSYTDKRSPSSSDAPDKGTATDAQKGRYHENRARRESSGSAPRSPRAERKRHGSVDRYQPQTKRSRQSSSMDASE